MIVHYDKDKYHTGKFFCGKKYNPMSYKQAWISGPDLPWEVNCKKCIAKRKRAKGAKR